MPTIINIRVLLLTCLVILGIEQVTGQQIDQGSIFSALGGKLLAWKINDTKYGVTIPDSLNIAMDPTADKLSIGFVHSGYSAGEPDGKNALLTLAVVLKKPSLSDVERRWIKEQGIILDDNVVQAVTRYRISLDLSADSGELKRLEELLHFPADFAVNQVYPIQIKWQNVNAKTLYDYLVQPAGLSIVVRIIVNLTVTVGTSICFDSISARRWWDQNSSDSKNYIILKGGADPVLLDLINSKVFANCKDGSIIDPRLRNGLKGKLSGILKKLSKGKYRLNKGDFFNTSWADQVSDSYQADVPPVLLTLSPGKVLLGHPELVKDLSSGGGKGLDALKGN
jgi:hypothetical protein